jgi:hypothetical protein
MKVIFDDLIPLLKKLNADWEPFLLKHNIQKDVAPLYEVYPRDQANTIVAYILLAYFQTSPWLRVNKDRLENKIEILSTLLKKKTSIEEPYKSLLDNNNIIANEVITWALQFQQDWRISQMETYRSYHAQMRLLYTKPSTTDLDFNIKLSKNMEEGRKAREEADKLQAEFDKEFTKLDSALLQEGRSKLSEIPSNMLTWEQYIALRNEEKKAAEERKQIRDTSTNDYYNK